jgi:hypothetical protein
MTTPPRPTKHEVKQALGFSTDAQLARLLNITPASVCEWRDGPIPEKQWMRLRYELRPDAFTAPSQRLAG